MELCILVLLCFGTAESSVFGTSHTDVEEFAKLKKLVATYDVKQTPQSQKGEEPTDIELYRAVLTALRILQSYVTLGTPRHVCYEYVGCFHSNGTMRHLLGVLPADPKHVSTTFVLHSGSSHAAPRTISYADSVNLVNFDPKLPTRFLVHGFGSSGQVGWVQRMRRKILERDPRTNVVVVDWHQGATYPNYLKAAANTELVGRQVALVVQRMVVLGAPPESIHLIGHSLGAQICGFAGQTLQKGGVKLGRISGLDPAAPLFCYDTNLPLSAHLGPEDAQFVDIIHSNGGIILAGDLGCYDKMGTVDFYPNGGRQQPGCAIRAFPDTANTRGDGHAYCSHGRAIDFFISSITPARSCRFSSFPCSSYEEYESGRSFSCEDGSCGEMGFYARSVTGRGRQCLGTLGDEPFCGSQLRIEMRGEIMPGDHFTLSLSDGHKTASDIELVASNKFTSAVKERVFQIVTVTPPASIDLDGPIVVRLSFTPKPKVHKEAARRHLISFSVTDQEGRSFHHCEHVEFSNQKPVKLVLRPRPCPP